MTETSFFNNNDLLEISRDSFDFKLNDNFLNNSHSPLRASQELKSYNSNINKDYKNDALLEYQNNVLRSNHNLMSQQAFSMSTEHFLLNQRLNTVQGHLSNVIKNWEEQSKKAIVYAKKIEVDNVKVKELCSMLQDATRQATSHALSLNNKEKKITELIKLLESRMKDINTLEVELTKTKQREASLELQYENSRKLLEVASEALKDFQNRSDIQFNIWNEKVIRLEKLDVERELELKSLNSDLKEEKKFAEKKYEEYENKIEQLKIENLSKSQDLKELKESSSVEIEKLNTTIIQLNLKHEEKLQQLISSHEFQIQQIKSIYEPKISQLESDLQLSQTQLQEVKNYSENLRQERIKDIFSQSEKFEEIMKKHMIEKEFMLQSHYEAIQSLQEKLIQQERDYISKLNEEKKKYLILQQEISSNLNQNSNLICQVCEKNYEELNTKKNKWKEEKKNIQEFLQKEIEKNKELQYNLDKQSLILSNNSKLVQSLGEENSQLKSSLENEKNSIIKIESILSTIKNENILLKEESNKLREESIQLRNENNSIKDKLNDKNLELSKLINKHQNEIIERLQDKSEKFEQILKDQISIETKASKDLDQFTTKHKEQIYRFSLFSQKIHEKFKENLIVLRIFLKWHEYTKESSYKKTQETIEKELEKLKQEFKSNNQDSKLSINKSIELKVKNIESYDKESISSTDKLNNSIDKSELFINSFEVNNSNSELHETVQNASLIQIKETQNSNNLPIEMLYNSTQQKPNNQSNSNLTITSDENTIISSTNNQIEEDPMFKLNEIFEQIVIQGNRVKKAVETFQNLQKETIIKIEVT